MITLEVTNIGNGPTTAVLDLPWSPGTWEWWALADGSNVTNGIPLSVSYDLENIKQIDFWILMPSLEAPGEFHEITVEVNPIDGEDINYSDNSVMFESVTDTIRQPRLDGFAVEEVIKQTQHSRSMLPLGTLVMLLIMAPEQDLYYNPHKAARTWLVSYQPILD